jgi:hypothetical protein
LAAVVDRGVDDVDARLERGTNRGGIPSIIGIVTLAQVRADSNRRCHEIANERPKEFGVETLGKSLPVALGPRRCGSFILTG